MTTAEWIIVVHTVHAIAKHAVKGVAQACGDPDDATVIGQLCDANTPLIYTEDADKTLVDIKDVILLGMANALEGCVTKARQGACFVLLLCDRTVCFIFLPLTSFVADLSSLNISTSFPDVMKHQRLSPTRSLQ